MYFRIGKIISENQKYGTNFINTLSTSLKLEFNDASGFSPRSLARMRKFYETYKDIAILPMPLAKLPWSFNCLLIEKIEENYKENYIRWKDGNLCPLHKTEPNKCGQLFITEDYLKKSFIKAMNELVGDIDIIKSNLMSKIEKLVNNETASSIQQLAEQLEEKQNSMMKLFKHKDTIPTEEYNKESNKLIEEISKINKKKEELEGNCSTAKLATDRLTEIEQYINSLKLEQEFNDEVFTSLVEQIVVRNRYELEFHFKIGIKKTIKE